MGHSWLQAISTWLIAAYDCLWLILLMAYGCMAALKLSSPGQAEAADRAVHRRTTRRAPPRLSRAQTCRHNYSTHPHQPTTHCRAVRRARQMVSSHGSLAHKRVGVTTAHTPTNQSPTAGLSGEQDKECLAKISYECSHSQ